MRYEDLSGSELFQQCAGSRNRDAWGEFHRRYHPLIAGVVIKTLAAYGQPKVDIAEDLIHEVYLRLCNQSGKALRSFVPAGEHSDFAYLKVIARNVVRDSSPAKQHGQTAPLEPAAVEVEDAPSVDSIERRVLLGEIERVLRGEASERDRRIFWLYYRAGLTASQIGSFRTIGLSAKGVESVLLRLTRTVREKLSEPPLTVEKGKPRRGVFS